MGKEAAYLLRDLADWRAAMSRGLPPLLCSDYEAVVRWRAVLLIAKGC